MRHRDLVGKNIAKLIKEKYLDNHARKVSRMVDKGLSMVGNLIKVSVNS